MQLAVLHGLTAEVQDSPDGFDEDVGSDEEEYSPSLPSPVKARSRVQQWIVDRFYEEPKWLNVFMAKTVKPMVQTLALSYTYSAKKKSIGGEKRDRDEEPSEPPKAIEKASNEAPTKRAKTASGSLKRKQWTMEETRVLCDGFIQYSTKWVEIARLPGLEMRTNMHCKDRMRVLMHRLGIADARKAAEEWLRQSEE